MASDWKCCEDPPLRRVSASRRVTRSVKGRRSGWDLASLSQGDTAEAGGGVPASHPLPKPQGAKGPKGAKGKGKSKGPLQPKLGCKQLESRVTSCLKPLDELWASVSDWN